ncbi:MAG: hypothetical protein AABM67_06350 [Acidobacteriota bacterium]
MSGFDINDPQVTGYLHPAYAASLAEFGTPRLLDHSLGWILEREIPGTRIRDAMGCYPLFACQNWSRLPDDLSELESDLVSLALVTDPFGDYSLEDLQACFPDRLLAFKEHFVVDFGAPESMSKHHRYYAQRARAAVEVEAIANGPGVLDEWIRLHANLSSRYGLTGIKAFSASSFGQQLNIPGVVILRAHQAGETVGAHIWYVQQQIAYSHLAALSERGYELMASYALYAYALEYFSDRVRLMDLGGSAGLGLNESRGNGLIRFKRGWANTTRTAYFCGKILNQKRYHELLGSSGALEDQYFPAYRAGEFIRD